MKPRHLPHLTAAAFFFIFAIPTVHAQDCTTVPSWVGSRPTSGDIFTYQSTVETYQQYSDPYTAPIGTPFGELYIHSLVPINSTGPYPMFNCNSKSGNINYEGSPGFGSSNNNIYPSGIPGIGYRIKIHTVDGVWNSGYMAPHSIYYNQIDNYPGKRITYAMIGLIKTGPISVIGPFTGVFAVEKFNSQVLFEYQFSGNFKPIYPVKLTCALKPTPPVDLGTHPITKFTGPQSTTPPQSFNVDLSCASTTPGSSINAYMAFTDNVNTANTSNALTLHSSPVTGLGVQILRNGNPVRFGPQNAGVGSPNVQNVGPITQPGAPGAFTYSVPLQARYVQTGSSVSGSGPAKAQAMVTVNYQ